MEFLMTPGKLLQKLRVPLGHLSAILFFLFARPTPTTLLAGLPLLVLGLAIRFWAAGHLRKGREVTRSGPYRYTRNPLYIGSFLAGLGACVQGGQLLFPLFFALLFVLLYYPVVLREEAELRNALGEPYRVYQSEVPRIWPRLPGAQGPGCFSLNQAMANREYQAPLGGLAFALLLLAKMHFQPQLAAWIPWLFR